MAMDGYTDGERLSFREIVSYGMGDLACSMIFNFMSSYLLYYHTDVAGLTVGAAGAVASFARLTDTLANPIVGVLSDRTRSRWGKLRPYLLFSSVPLALSVALMFLASWIPAKNRAIYALVTYTLFCLLYTACNVPYTAMMPNISEDRTQRGRLNMARFICASVGTLFSMGLALPLVTLLGQGDGQQGFWRLSLLFSLLILVCVLICFAYTRERVQPSPASFSLRTLGGTVQKSRPWVLCCAAQFFHYLAVTTRNSTAMYYAKYHLDAPGFASLLLAVNAFTTFAAALLIPFLTARMTKRNISILGYSLFIAGSLPIYLAGKELIAVLLLNILAASGVSLAAGVSFLILGETIDHAEYVTGIRQQGLLTSLSMSMAKLGMVSSGLASSLVLDMGGYVADGPQTSGALFAIQTAFIFLPCAASLVCAALFLFYHLDDEYPAIRAALFQRRGRQQ